MLFGKNRCNPCDPCASTPCSPCPPTASQGCPCPTLFAQTLTDGTSVLLAAQAAWTQVPGVQVAPFVSSAPEFLQIDATASVLMNGGGPGVRAAYFRVLVDNEEVDGNRFGLSSVDVPGRESGAVTLRVSVAAGAHVVSLEWSSAPAGASPAGAVGSATVDAFGHANLRVIRTSS